MRIRSSYLFWLYSIVPALAADVATASVSIKPLVYEANLGQADRQVAFLARTPQYRLLVYNDGSADFVSPSNRRVIRLELAHPRPHRRPVGEERLASVTRIYRGSDPERWLPEIPNYRNVRSQGVYPGIDLVWTGQQGAVESDFIVAPGADPAQIAWRFRGARSMRVERSGDLLINGSGQLLRCLRPIASQLIGGTQHSVGVRYIVSRGVVKLALDPYDQHSQLTIDPVIAYAANVGGSGFDASYGIASDTSHNIYVTGETASTDFPGATGPRLNRDVFVAKYSPAGSRLYTTILSSTGNDAGYSIAVDANQNAYVAGTVGGTGFPTTPGAFRTTSLGAPDGFVARLNANGQLFYSTLLGGSQSDSITGIAVDTTGNTYVTGTTTSVDFPVTTGAPQVVSHGGSDGFVTKLNASGSGLIYSTYVGGSGQDFSQSIAVNAAGTACIAGSTTSTDLAVANAMDATFTGSMNVMVGCLNAAGTGWSFLTYLGGSIRDLGQAIALDAAGNIYLTGTTASFDFPVTAGCPQASLAGLYNAFVTKLAASGQSILYSTFLGGSGSDTGNAIGVDRLGRAVVSGSTNSPNFPEQNPVQSAFGGSFDAFLTEMNASGSSFVFSSYFGGSGDDRAFALSLAALNFAHPDPSFWLSGYTSSLNLPGASTSGVPTPYNAFMAQIYFRPQVGSYQNGTWILDANGDGVFDAGDLTIAWGQPGSTPIFGDWNGDGRTKVGSFFQGDFFLDVNGDGFFDAGDVVIAWGSPTSVPVLGDWNGDGRTKIGVFEQGLWSLDVNGDGLFDAGDRVFVWGTAAAIPVVGDWTGDGRSKIGIFQQGIWYLDVADTGFWAAGDMAFAWGTPTATPVVGDWSGNGKSKVGVFESGNWFLDVNGTGVWAAGDLAFGWGSATSIPVVGDWNGDGRSKVGIVDSGVWSLDTNGDTLWDAGDQRFTFGSLGATPVVGLWK